MGQHEYGVGLAAKPDEMARVALAFRAGEQKERDRVRNLLISLGQDKIISDLGVGESDKILQANPPEPQH